MTVVDRRSGSTPSACWDSDWIEGDGGSTSSVCRDGYRIEGDGDWISIAGVRLSLQGGWQKANESLGLYQRENGYTPALERRAWAKITERITKVLIVRFGRKNKRVG